MKSDNSNEPITLGILKKEKSSKPAFVLICFMLLLGTCFGLPYIKAVSYTHLTLPTN